MTLETLYKRAKTGDIQYWKVYTEAAGPGTGKNIICKESGRLGTDNPIRHTETITEGKQKRNLEEQAAFQAQSDWRKKQDDGYKTLEDLQITLTPTSETRKIYSFPVPTNHKDFPMSSTEETAQGLEIALQIRLPQFNTDASGNVKPMLAKDWNKGKGIKFPQQQDRKMDGVRTTVVIDILSEHTHQTKILSRNGKPYDTLTHLQDFIAHALLEERIPRERIILDGEIYYHGWTLEEINQAVKKYRPGITEKLEFWFFDLPLLHDLPQAKRTEKVHELAWTLDREQKLIKPVETVLVHSVEEAIANHDKWVLDGFEGAMLKNPQATYEQGARSSNWRKMKEFDETEFDIIGYKCGQRGSEDLMLVIQSADEQVPVKMMGTRETKEQLYRQAVAGDLTGKKLTVKHFGLTKYGVVNLPTGKAVRDYE